MNDAEADLLSSRLVDLLSSRLVDMLLSRLVDFLWIDCLDCENGEE